MDSKIAELRKRLLAANDLASAAAVLHWDQATYMPSGGASARARQMATLQRLSHEMFTDPAIGRLLNELRSFEASRPYDSDEASLVRVTRRDYEKAVKVPPEFMGQLSAHAAESYEKWVEARPANDFAAVRPCLEKTLDLSLQLANYFPGYEHVADPLIDFADYGMKVSTVQPLFAELRRELVPLAEAITSRPPADDSCLCQKFPEPQQLAFGLDVIRRLGYDFDRGRQDKTHHPFMTKFALGDVRITTRVRENHLSEALFGTIHETGHALYEQGICMELDGTPLADGTSSGVHESQSRLWENVVGRSRGFWQFFYPKLQAVFPGQLDQVPLDVFHRAINKVERSLIRTDADEVTYNLHVMIRFDLELQLLGGRLRVRDLPEAWRERYKSDIGVAPSDDKDGVLQDVHWYAGMVGGSFQGYTLGNIMAAQFFDAALHAHPQIPDEMAKGQFDTLRVWLRENIYQHGKKFTAEELVKRVTGKPISITAYVRYLKNKYGELYDV